MGAAKQMPVSDTSSVRSKEHDPFQRMMHLILGYVLAVAAGSIIFALLFPLAVPDVPTSNSLEEWWNGMLGMVVATFVMGFLFGLPYTVLGIVAFRYLLPRTMLVFLVVGSLCPSAAIVTMSLAFSGPTKWIDGEWLRIIIFTLPSGLIAAYLFGAIGLGYGFGKWRPDVGAS
jgi:hypothetical protein